MDKLTPTNASAPTIWRQLPRRILQVFVIILVMDAILFGAAGRLDWPEAWGLSLLYLGFLLAALVWSLRHDPDLLVERGRVAPNVKTWDKAIGVAYTILLLGMLVVAGLDAGRFRWSAMPLGVEALGFLGLILSGAVIAWAAVTNAYLSRWARIQADRGQRVITTGPYQHVRHPMYAATLPFVVSISLALGSWWALVPGGLIGVLYAIRTVLEDRMLHDELPGYCEYAARVRHRWLPGVW